MRVVPSYDHLGPTGLLEHVEHFGLEDVVNRFDSDSRSGLRHGKDVYAGYLMSARAATRRAHSVIIDKLSQHQSHHFHRHTSATVLEHLEKREGRDVDRLAAGGQY